MKTQSDKMRNQRHRLVEPGDPVLWRAAEYIQPGEDLSFLADMEKVFRSSANAVGLAAPQIGISKRVILLCPEVTQRYMDRKKVRLRFYANPEITWHSDTTEEALEGCLSFPGAIASVARWFEIGFRAHPLKDFHFSNTVVNEHHIGWEARVAQHEIDHLNGICHVGSEWRRSRLRSAFR